MYTSYHPRSSRDAARPPASTEAPSKGKNKAEEMPPERPTRRVNVSPRQKQPADETWGRFDTLLSGGEGPDGALMVESRIPILPPPAGPLPAPPVQERPYCHPAPLVVRPRPNMPTRTSSSYTVKPLKAPLQDPYDPAHYRLPPIRERVISSPLVPRVTDMRVEVDRDPQRQQDTYSVQVSFQFSMQPPEQP